MIPHITIGCKYFFKTDIIYMRKTQPRYGWHSATKGCDTKNCLQPKLKIFNMEDLKDQDSSLEFLCVGCKKPFQITRSRYNEALRRRSKGLYCSNRCLGLASRKVENIHFYDKTSKCENCSKMFRPRKNHANRFCSKACFAEISKKFAKIKQEVVCPNCGNKFYKKDYRAVYCSRQCVSSMRQNNKFEPLPRIRVGKPRYCTLCGKNEIFNKEKIL